MNSTTVVMIAILAAILLPAVILSGRHLKGEGECCGGPKEKPVHKKNAGEKKAELLVKIDGMHCTNCKNSIERHLDELDGVIAKVNLEKKHAIVSLYEDIEQEVIRKTIEDLDFTVKDIKVL